MKMGSRLVGAVVIGFLVVLAVGVGVLATPKGAGTTAVAYVDSARLLAKHPDMVKATEKLRVRTSALQVELDAKVKSVDKAGQEKLLTEYQGKLDAEKQASQGEALKKVNTQIRETARKLGYSLVLDSRAVIYGGTDITADVLKSAGVSK